MSVNASTQIPRTSDPAVFQRQCKVLFEHVLNDPHIEEFGTSGQGQSGIDLLGRRRDRGLDHWVGVQCKLTIKSKKLKAGENGVVEVEATRALGFKPALKELIIATTASNDAILQREAALFTDGQAKLGRGLHRPSFDGSTPTDRMSGNLRSPLFCVQRILLAKARERARPLIGAFGCDALSAAEGFGSGSPCGRRGAIGEIVEPNGSKPASPRYSVDAPCGRASAFNAPRLFAAIPHFV